MICTIGAWYKSFVPRCHFYVFSSFCSENARLYSVLNACLCEMDKFLSNNNNNNNILSVNPYIVSATIIL